MKRINFYVASAIAIMALASCSSDDSITGGGSVEPMKVTGLQLDNLNAQSLGANIVNMYGSNEGTRAANVSNWGLLTSMPKYEDLDKSGAVTLSGNVDNLNLGAAKVYICDGDVTLNNVWGEGTIIVPKGASLKFNEEGQTFLHNAQVTLYCYGKLKVTDGLYIGNGNGNGQKIYIDGDLNLGEKPLAVQGCLYVSGNVKASSTTYNGQIFNQTARVNVLGNFEIAGDIKFDGNNHIGGAITAKNILIGSSAQVASDCKVEAENEIEVNSNGVSLLANYIHCKELKQCAASSIELEDKGLIKVDDTYTNLNNGNDASVIVKGNKALAVVFAPKFVANYGDNQKACYIFKAQGEGARMALNIGAYYRSNDNTPYTYNDFDFFGNTVDATNNKDNVVNIKADDCKPGFSNKGEDPTPASPELDDVSSVEYPEHTHDISATCVQVANGHIYLSYHQNGKKQSGCIEVLSTDASNNKTTLNQFVCDHNKELDYNHLIVDNADKRIYLAGNSRFKSGILAWIGLNNEGLLDTQAKETESQTGLPLNLISMKGHKEWKGQENPDTIPDGDANCVIRNGNYLEVMTTSGYRIFDISGDAPVLSGKNLFKLRAKHIDADDKHIVTLRYLENPSDENARVKAQLELYAKSDVNLENAKATYNDDKFSIAPNNGKNVVKIDGDYVYVCTSTDGLKVFKIEGDKLNLVGTYQPKNVIIANEESAKKGMPKALCNGCAVDSKYIYLAYGSFGLIVLDKAKVQAGETDPSKCEVAKKKASKSANYVALGNGYIYVAYGRDRLQVFKLVNKSATSGDTSYQTGK